MKMVFVMILIFLVLYFFVIVFWIIGDILVIVVFYFIICELVIGNRLCIDLRNFSYFVSLGWLFLLMIVCLVFVLKMWKLLDGMNDLYEIMYCFFILFILWIMFIFLYVFFDNKVVKVMFFFIVLVVYGMLCLLCLFVMKIYIVVFCFEKNNKEWVMCIMLSCSWNLFSGSFYGSYVGDKRFLLVLILEDKILINVFRKLFIVCGLYLVILYFFFGIFNIYIVDYMY